MRPTALTGVGLPLAVAAGVAIAFGFGSHAATGAAERDDEPGRSVSFRSPGAGYHGYEDVDALLRQWAEASPRVSWVELGATFGGRSIPAIEFGARVERANPGRTVVLLGGVDGISQSGSEAVLATTHALLGQLDFLEPSLSFLVIPWAAPDALANVHAVGDPGGRNLVPVDDDEDGLIDEDPPDDLDGDGHVLEMLLPDSNGQWCFSQDGRFLVPATPRDPRRFRRTREGRDDDEDGLFNEDGLGGIDYDAHFPVGWAGPRADGSGGRWPLEDPVPRRIADELSARDLVMAFVFQGHHGGLRFAGESLPVPEARQRIQLAFERATGRRVRPPVSAPLRGGRLADWVHETLGTEVIEVSAWGPEAVGVDGRPFVLRSAAEHGSGSTGTAQGEGRARSSLDHSRGALDTGRALAGDDYRWARWLDDVRGGDGFLQWHPVDLGKGLTGWVGGWEPRTRTDPPEDSLADALVGIPRFVQAVTAALPRLELEVVETTRLGDVLHVSVRVVNRGELGTEFVDRDGLGAVTVELETACDAAIAAGETSVTLERLGPGETSRVFEWLVSVPEGGALRVRATAARSVEVVREIRP